MHIVDHAHPLHDQFCRCTSCKPPLVGAARTSARGWLGAIGFALSTVITAAIVRFFHA